MEIATRVDLDEKNIDRYYKKLDEYQKQYYTYLTDNKTSVVCVDSCAGTGKSTVAVMAALQLLKEDRVASIYYVRFADDRSLRLGFLPGDTTDKTSIYMVPFYDACLEFGLTRDHVDQLVAEDKVKLCTDITMRGINIDRAFILIDESQNARFSDLKLVLTRIKDNCKVALLGHHGQNDNYKGVPDDAFRRYINHLCKKSWAVECQLPNNYRGKISSYADKLMA